MADLNGQADSSTATSRKLLALDGGGIRGVMSLEILRKIETGPGDGHRQRRVIPPRRFLRLYRRHQYRRHHCGRPGDGKVGSGTDRFLHRRRTADVRKNIPDRPAAQLLSGRSAAQEAEQRVRGSHAWRRRPAFAAADRHAKCNDGFAVARLQQSPCPLQRSQPSGQQFENSTVAAGAGEHRRTRLFSA